MKRWVYFLIVLCICTPVYGDSTKAAIVGAFALQILEPDGVMDIRLDCEVQSNCSITMISRSENNPLLEDTQKLEVLPIKDLTEATDALRYTIGYRSLQIRDKEARELMSRLRPALLSNPIISSCWDLNYQAPGFMLACTFSNAPSKNPPVYLFSRNQAKCGEVFCKYVIIPMSRVR